MGRSAQYLFAHASLHMLLCMPLACGRQAPGLADTTAPDASVAEPSRDGGAQGSMRPDAALAMSGPVAGEQRTGELGGRVAAAAGGGAGAAGAGAARAPESGICPARDSAAYEVLETRCDGLDNDCDGWVDVLLPVAENRCAEAGACISGFAACRDGSRVCMAEGPAPDTFDDADNDCDGVVDDVDTRAARPRVLLMFAPYLVSEGGAGIDNVAASLEQWGIPYDRPPSDELFEQQLERLPSYPLAVLPGYNVSEFLTEARVAALQQYVLNGGTLLVWKPALTSSGPAQALLGLASTEKRRDVETLRFAGTSMPATRAFDSPEEQEVPLTAVVEEERPDVWVLEPSGADVEVGAHALIDGRPVGALLTRRAAGSGVVYALGHDLLTFRHTRCYVNCFEPSSDLAGLLLREVFRESVRGHVAFKHTVAGLEDSLVILSHDVDAPDAHNAGPAWGKPGAEQVAELEVQHGARGSFFITTDYLAPYYNPQLMQRLCELGVCPTGVHSVRHGALTQSVPTGDCTETRADYFARETLCGEVRVPIEILSQDIGVRPRAWRSPFLYVHPQMYDVLASQGIAFDSSYAVGDLKFNLPLSLARIGLNQHVFHHQPLYTMPIALEDGIGDIVEGNTTREEMSAGNAHKFAHRWRYTMLRNADNAAHTMVLLHPSFGLGVPEDNLRHKLAVERTFLEQSVERKVKLDSTVDDLLTFWRAREATDLDVRFDGEAYTGTIRVGEHAMRGLTLEFGDVIERFDCGSCGATRSQRQRVHIEGTLAAQSSHAFTAQVRK